MKNLIILILTFTFSFQVLAKEYALQILEQTQSVLETRDNALSLEQAKELAVGDNIDVKIAYERLFQAQRKINLARAQFFPYGVGDVAVIYFTNAFSTLILIELATSIPMKWYNVKKEKHLRNAEAWSLKALTENIKNQTALLYYNILKEESMLRLTSYELKLMEELIAARAVEAQVGVYDANDLRDLRYRFLNLRDEYLKFEAYLAEEKAAMKMLLNLPYTTDLVLQPVASFLNDTDFDLDVESLALMAQNRSYEVKSAEQVVQAAYDSKRSTQWSILSFSGIGFGYLANVRMEKSKVREAQYRLEATRENIYNNVYTRSGMFRNSVEFFLNEKIISDTTEKFMKGQLEVFNKGELAVSELIESELYYLRDFRDMLRAHYNAYVRLDDLERVVQGNVDELLYADARFSVLAEQSETMTYISLVDPDGLSDEIESVTYMFENQNVNDIKSFRSRSNFSVRVSNRNLSFPIVLKAQVIFRNGEIVTKKIKIKK
tara:strand:+ start:37948 stop:39423 length:1476 start_codon:yes stop_codon:yes gene_type:complete